MFDLPNANMRRVTGGELVFGGRSLRESRRSRLWTFTHRNFDSTVDMADFQDVKNRDLSIRYQGNRIQEWWTGALLFFRSSAKHRGRLSPAGFAARSMNITPFQQSIGRVLRHDATEIMLQDKVATIELI
jgi:hypothetical protein